MANIKVTQDIITVTVYPGIKNLPHELLRVVNSLVCRGISGHCYAITFTLMTDQIPLEA